MSNENPIKPTIEIETRGTKGIETQLEEVDVESGYDEVFIAVRNGLLDDPTKFYIDATDTGVSVKARDSDTTIYYTDFPREMEELKNVGLTK